jgi:hypothetical protein
VGVQHVREANATQLKKEFCEIAFKDGESIDDFSTRIVSLANKIRVLGADLGDTEIVKKILEVILDSLSQVAIAIETFYDLSSQHPVNRGGGWSLVTSGRAPEEEEGGATAGVSCGSCSCLARTTRRRPSRTFRHPSRWRPAAS